MLKEIKQANYSTHLNGIQQGGRNQYTYLINMFHLPECHNKINKHLHKCFLYKYFSYGKKHKKLV